MQRGKKIEKPGGRVSFELAMITKNIIFYLFLLLISLYYFNILHFNNKIDIFQALRCVAF